MAFSLGGGGSSNGRNRFRGRHSSMSEINIVPLVDVVLVLLIIFMLTAHVMEYGLEVDVPKVKQVKTTTKDLPVISITKSGAIYLGKDEININRIPAAVQQRFGANQAVFVKADKETPWDPIAQVVSVLGEAHLSVQMVTQLEDQTEKRRR